jgi:hypothetical protein
MSAHRNETILFLSVAVFSLSVASPSLAGGDTGTSGTWDQNPAPVYQQPVYQSPTYQQQTYQQPSYSQQYTPSGTQPQPGQKGYWASLLGQAFLQPLGIGAGGLVVDIASSLWSGIKSLFGGDKKSEQVAISQPTFQANMPVSFAGVPSNAVAPTPAPIPPGVTTASGVLYSIDRLDDNYLVRETIQAQPGVLPIFASGERFVIRYTSNLPGVVVIENIDARGVKAYLGTFVVQAGTEHRFPETKAMRLDNNIGTETYQLNFMPCLAQDYATRSDVMALQGKIPMCGSTQQAAQMIARSKGSSRAKGTFNEALQLADGSSGVVFSAAPYQNGDVLVTTFYLNHVASR